MGLLLETGLGRGLAEAEARRRERYGANVLPRTRRAGPLVRVLHQVTDPLIYVLLAAGAVTVALGEHVDATVIFGAGAATAEARTAAVNLFVTVQLFYLFSCRSLAGPAWRAGIFANRWIVAGVTVQIAGQLALTYLPTMNRLFRTAPVTGGTWLRILVLALAASLIIAVGKRLTRGPRDTLASRPPGHPARRSSR